MGTKVGTAFLAASFVSGKNQAGIADDYLAWIDGQGNEDAACDALLAACRSSSNPGRVLYAADEFYAKFEGGYEPGADTGAQAEPNPDPEVADEPPADVEKAKTDAVGTATVEGEPARSVSADADAADHVKDHLSGAPDVDEDDDEADDDEDGEDKPAPKKRAARKAVTHG